jgi:hypothetical protein
MWRSHLVKLWFRLTFLLASLTGMATTIVAEEGARCGVVGMIELGAGPGSSTTCWWPNAALMDTALAIAPAYADWKRRTGGFFYCH